MSRKIILIIKLILLALVVYFVFSLIFVDVMYGLMGFNNHVYYTNQRTPEKYGLISEERQIMTSDKMMINIYEVKVDNPKGVVILLSGIQGPCVTHMYGNAKLFAENGYASILVDVRGHGKSSGNKITFGIDDVRDVAAVVNYINTQERYFNIPILVMGVSMGGATAITSASLIDDIDGLIAMSAFSSWTDVCLDTLEVIGIPRFIAEIFRPSVIIHGFCNYGLDFFKNEPKEAIKQIGDKPILFVHSSGDSVVPIKNNERILQNYLGNNATVWIRETDFHFIVLKNELDDPHTDSDYCDKIVAFLEENFA